MSHIITNTLYSNHVIFWVISHDYYCFTNMETKAQGGFAQGDV